MRLPDELMMIIYDFCPRSTLVNCIVLDHRQFDLVVKRLWRVFDSPKLNLESITARRLNRVSQSLPSACRITWLIGATGTPAETLLRHPPLPHQDPLVTGRLGNPHEI